jgi:CHAT domain-containing protein/Tfp pilus assembly protein PilF
MDDADLLATLSTNLGGVHYLLGEPEPALRHFGRALELRRARHEDRGEADVLNNLAALHMATGDFQEALLGYERTLEIYRQLEDVRGEARTLNNLGNVYQRLGDHERARTHYESALPLRRRAQDARGEAVTLNNLGNLLRLGGEPREALARHRAALELRGAQGHRRGEGLTLQLMGRAHLGLGDAPAALDHLGRAAEALREVGDRRRLAETQRYRGEALVIAGRRGEAAAALAEALDLFRGAGDRSGEATVQIALAGVDRAADRPAAALERLQAAIDLLEGLRAGLDAPDLRASYLASQRSAFEQLVDLHVAAGRIERALEVAEAASARSLLDVVQGAGADLPRSIDPALAARRDALERELRIKIDRRLDVDEAAAPQQVARLEGEIDALLTGLDAAEARLRGASARYAELTRPPILTAAEMQELLEPGTVALRYSLGEERSWLWRLGRAGIAVYELPPRRRLEELGRAVHEAMSTPAVAGDDADPSAAAAELAQLLLGPVTLAPGTDRLLVIADGALHYLPFAALPMPGEPAAVLLDRYELVTAPSMSVLALQRRALGRRRAAGGTLAVVADPVFDAADHRVSLAATAAGSDGAVRRGGGFARLRFSRREADAIAALVAPPQRLLALDFEASRDTVMGGALEPFRIVHFATHGVLDAQRPELSGLMLSRVDAAGRSRLGLLGLRDIYELPLAADLVVLSGCRTALGREVRGEGLVGLTRGFLYAGVPRVVASLWQVDDRATAALMERFYRGVLADGLAPGEALRRAQLGLRADPRTRDPYYWGAFLLQGDWRRSPPAEGNHAAAADTLH